MLLRKKKKINKTHTKKSSKKKDKNCKLEKSEQNGNTKSLPISNYLKDKWIKLFNQKTQNE